MAEKQITPLQRAQNFAAATRQYMQQLPTQKVTDANTTMQFNLPKARLLAGIDLCVEAKVKTLGTGINYEKVLRRIALDLNNGFAPYVVTGEQLYLKNCLRNNSQANMRSVATATSGSDTISTVKFMLSMPCVLNDNTPNGLYLLQNDTTNVTLTVDVASDTDMGASAEIQEVRVSPMLTTFSVPMVAEAMPDITWLKLVQGYNENFAGVGQNIIKMRVGMIYRQIIFRLTEADGDVFPEANITSNFDLVFNQADNPYSISAEQLRMMNTAQYGAALPAGVYAFDFSTLRGGNSGFAGSRDYIDTDKLTEFWLRFNTSAAGNIEVITETLVKLS